MLTSLAFIFLFGLLFGAVFQKFKLPRLLGFIAAGVVLGPYQGGLLAEPILTVSAELRQFALVIILMRAGLSLELKDLKRIGRPAFLMCFVPACFEIIGTILLAPILLGVSYLEAAIIGSVIAAVSPAVIVPRMLKLMEEGYGGDRKIPQLIMAGASVDDVFVIALFTSFTSLAAGGSISLVRFMKAPISIILGFLLGSAVGFLCSVFFRKYAMKDSVKTLILLSVSFLLVALEQTIGRIAPVSGLLAVMAMGVTLFNQDEVLAKRLSNQFAQLWVGAEILLFVLVGAAVDGRSVYASGMAAALLIFGAVLFRIAGVFLCLVKTELLWKERLFCMIAYLPKATVQAAIGGLPLAMGLPCGPVVLTVAVMSIFVTAPFGAFGIDATYRKFLKVSSTDGGAKM